MITLRLLGSIDLWDEHGEPIEAVLRRPKLLALLAYLAIARPRGFHRKDKLLALFWPESDQERARHALRQALYVLRRELGEDAIHTRGEDDVAVNAHVVSSDVDAFEAEVDREDFAGALSHYRGEFLAGLFISDAPPFEQWVEGERNRLARAYGRVMEQLAERATQTGDRLAAVSWWRRVSEQDPYSTRVALRLMEALEAAGDRAGALQYAERHTARLKKELGAEPAPDVVALADRLRVDPNQHTPTERLGRFRKAGGLHATDREVDSAQVSAATTNRIASPFGSSVHRFVWAALATLLVIVVLWAWRRPSPSIPARHASLALPEDAAVSFAPGPLGIVYPTLALSPDGSLLAYVAASDNGTRLHVRQLDSYDTRPLPGTEGALAPFFSPDGEWVGYFTATELMKVPVRGGEPILLTKVQHPLGGSWAPNNRILYADTENEDLFEVPASGGQPRLLLNQGGRLPDLLPDGAGVLTEQGMWLLAVSAGGEKVAITENGSMGRYLPPGYVVFMRENGLWAVAFDSEKLRVRGHPFRVVERVRRDGTWAGQFALSSSGTFVYAQGPDLRNVQLVWVDQAGEVEELPFERNAFTNFSLSPDEKRFVTRIAGDIWIFDLKRESASLLVRGNLTAPHWYPDGTRVTYRDRARRGIYSKLVDDIAPADLVMRDAGDSIFRGPRAWSPDGSRFATVVHVDGAPGDVISIDLADEGRRQMIAGLTGVEEDWPSFSPDGNLIAYQSKVSGVAQLYVQPFPPTGDVVQVSVDGGAEEPRWASSGQELVYRSGRQWLAVAIKTEPRLHASRPRVVREGDFLNVPGYSWDMTGDGDRFLLVRGPDIPETLPRLNVIFNFVTEVEAARQR